MNEVEVTVEKAKKLLEFCPKDTIQITYADWSAGHSDTQAWRTAKLTVARPVSDEPDHIEIYLDRGGKRSTFQLNIDLAEVGVLYRIFGEMLN